MPTHPGGGFTELLGLSAAGSRDAFDEIFRIVYDELRRLARKQLIGQWGQYTLDTTSLVHETYLKLVNATSVSERDRAYFFGAAARAMRQVLVDASRRRKRVKRGGGMVNTSLDEATVAVDEFAADVVALSECLEALSELVPRQARIVEFRFFGGLTVDEVAETMDLSRRTVLRDWTLARAWLLRELSRGDDAENRPVTD